MEGSEDNKSLTILQASGAGGEISRHWPRKGMILIREPGIACMSSVRLLPLLGHEQRVIGRSFLSPRITGTAPLCKTATHKDPYRSRQLNRARCLKQPAPTWFENESHSYTGWPLHRFQPPLHPPLHLGPSSQVGNRLQEMIRSPLYSLWKT